MPDVNTLLKAKVGVYRVVLTKKEFDRARNRYIKLLAEGKIDDEW